MITSILSYMLTLLGICLLSSSFAIIICVASISRSCTEQSADHGTSQEGEEEDKTRLGGSEEATEDKRYISKPAGLRISRMKSSQEHWIFCSKWIHLDSL